jgi:hypothetical protein
MVATLTACPPPCEYRLTDHGTLSEEAIRCSPYLDGQTYSFIHSGGQKVSFLASRTREERTAFRDDCHEVRSESDVSTLTPDYPLFSCNVGIHKTDSAWFECIIWAGGSGFWLPYTSQILKDYIYFDSLQFGQNWYREVYKIGNSWSNGIPEGEIKADSIYYNTSHGILNILMTNGEFYEISD